MLAPSLEALDGLKTVLEGLQDHVGESLLIGQQLDPKVLNVRCHFAIPLDELLCFFFVLFCFFFLFFLSNFFNLEMRKQVKVFDFGLATRRQEEVIDRLIFNLTRGQIGVIVENDLCVEQRVEASRSLGCCVVIIKLHDHDLFHLLTAMVVQFFDPLEHL